MLLENSFGVNSCQKSSWAYKSVTEIFGINTEHIKQLSDEAARELIARLCKAELRRQNLPESSVTWGGDQRAKDGGVDVRVDCHSALTSADFIRTPLMAFQVKAEIFAPSKIEPEMAPKGVIRSAIIDLGNQGGTYVIASSRDDVSDASLRARRTAISNCLEKFGVGSAIQSDFYGSRQIADWVEQYPAIANWVRHKLNIPLNGWRPYGPWAYNEDSVDLEYVIDDQARIFIPGAEDSSTITEAITRLRRDLVNQVSIRITGLSGVGKTRFVQALFDPRVCDQGNVLPADKVIYTDLADKPYPQPKALILDLMERNADEVVILDNCGSETHNRLTELINRPGVDLKLITIEYDIRDDLTEGTLCYRLEGSSPAVITKLLKSRYPLLSSNDADRIAEFSDGNSRVAFALASTIENGGELSQLRDDELFKRLFQQKNDPNEELLRCAEAASLMYSFDGEDFSLDSEMARLAKFAEVTPMMFSRHMADLRRRGLLQQRGKWRAVLPHAIANRLAIRLLEALPSDFLLQALVEQANERVARSFSHRLGYLHDSKEAVGIASRLLAIGGKLGDLTSLSRFERYMFVNIAPVDPLGALQGLESASAAETFICVDNNERALFARTARSLAYDKEFFDRAIEVLKRFALAEPGGNNNEPSREMLKSLFYCHLSGTRATVRQRLMAATALLTSSERRERDVGYELLEAGLEATHFSSHYDFEFGARSRDYGWFPRSQAEVRDWYLPWIEVAAEIGLRVDSEGRRARTVLGEAIRGLWGRVGLDDEIAEIATRLQKVDGWPEGWLGIRRILQWDAENLTSPAISQLRKLERLLTPSNLVTEIRARVLAKGTLSCDLDAENRELVDAKVDASERRHRAQTRAEALGAQAAATPDLLNDLLPDLVSNAGSGNLYNFGYGVGRTYEGVYDFLVAVRSVVENADRSEISLLFVRGLLRGWDEVEPGDVQQGCSTLIT